jgi:iron(III) transport system permease protein
MLDPMVPAAAGIPVARRRRQTPKAMMGVALATALVANLPLIYLFVRAVARGGSAYVEVVWTGEVLALLGRTLSLVAGVVVATLAIALPMAWLVVRTDLPARRIWAVLGALPLVFPSYVAAFCLVAVLGPRGYLQAWLAPLGVDALPPWIYGYPGALLVLSLFTYPYAYLLLVAALRDMNPSFEEGSRSLGAGRWETFFRVTLPNLKPALLGGSLLAILYALSDFGGVSIVRYDTFTLSIYNAYRALFDRTVAAALSTILVFLTLGFVALEAAWMRRVRPSRSRPARPAPLVRLGGWKWPALAGLGSIALFNLAIPLGVICFWGVRAYLVGNPLGEAWQAALNSVGVSAGAALVAVTLALPVAYWAARSTSRLALAVERLCHSGFALPGIVIGLALVFFASRLLRPLYQSLALLLIAYVVRFLPQALTAVRSSLAALAPVFEEAARSLGRGPWSVFRTVVVPVIRPGLLTGGGLVFLTAMKELPATLLLRPTGFETLAIRIWTTADEGVYSQAAVPALLLVVGSAVPLYLLIIRPALRVSRRSEWNSASGGWV